MIELLASSIIIYGNANGVWSPSHPDIYPYSEPSTPVEKPEIPKTSTTRGNGDIIFPQLLE